MTGFDLAALARPKTRAQALADSTLVDCSAAAAFVGFRAPTAMTAAAWDELVGTPGVRATRAEVQLAVASLRRVLQDAGRAVGRYKALGLVRADVRFHSRTPAGRKVLLVLRCTVDAGAPALTLSLDEGL